MFISFVLKMHASGKMKEMRKNQKELRQGSRKIMEGPICCGIRRMRQLKMERGEKMQKMDGRWFRFGRGFGRVWLWSQGEPLNLGWSRAGKR